MVAYLSVDSGPEKGKHFPLDPDRPMHLGRGSSCEIRLNDPISSRFHAVLYFDDGCWHIRDTSSRNGTLVNGQKVDHARLMDSTVIKIGSSAMRLVDQDSDLSADSPEMQTVVVDASMSDSHLLDQNPLHRAVDPGHVIDLYSLSLRLLQTDNPDNVVATVIELLRDRTSADVVGLSYNSGDGRQKPQRVIPPTAFDSVKLNRAFFRRIIRNGEAVWVNDHRHDHPDHHKMDRRIKEWSDAMYIPLESGENNLGVLQLYRSQSFRESDFDLAIAAGRLLAVGLKRVLELDSLRAQRTRIAAQNADTDELIGRSPVMMKLKERIERVGKASGSVLVRGESGSGKELVARAVHRYSQRAQRPMLTVNCAAIPQDLIESQLFGHRKGSFTGADSDHIGWFQQAHTGTLFLDEIGELTLEGQAKLLRILEGHPFLPVGATEEVLVDVRVIAATNRDLSEFVREKKFREDLFYRLSVFELFVPPLRERGDDIDLLTNHFLDHFRVQHGRVYLQLSDNARERLLEYPWPGNVRQLRNVIDSAVVMADDPAIDSDDLGLRDAGTSRLDTLIIEEWERRLIRKALTRTGGSIPQAAKLLGISRATAYRKIADYGIDH
jgi:Nif-specific regulatory protein